MTWRPEKSNHYESNQGNLDSSEIARLDGYIEEYLHQSPQLEDFADIRPAEEIERDKTEVERLKKIFETDPAGNKELMRYALALEMILVEFSSSWIPGYLSRASEYDDFLNHTDLVLEMENDRDQILRVAIDATFSAKKTEKKIARLVEELRGGHLTRLKYFQSQLDDTREKKTVPRVVLGSDNMLQISQLARLYMNYRETQGLKKKTYRTAITDHPIGQEILEEIEFQLQQSIEVLKSAVGVRKEELDKKISTIKAAVAEFNSFKQKAAAQHPRGDLDTTSRPNGVLDAIRSSFALA